MVKNDCNLQINDDRIFKQTQIRWRSKKVPLLQFLNILSFWNIESGSFSCSVNLFYLTNIFLKNVFQIYTLFESFGYFSVECRRG